jgi:glycosyltransferase involved in cell wall biosynthesis
MTPAKVLACHNHYAHRGGESAVFENLIKGLRQRGHHVVTYLRDNVSIDAMSSTDRVWLLASAYHSRRTRQELTDLVKTERPDIAIVQNVFPLASPSVYTTLAALGVPIIQATYNYRLVCPAGELYSRGEICERCLGGNPLPCVLRRCYRDSALMSAWYASIVGWHRWSQTFARTVQVFQVPDEFMAAKLAEGGLPRSKMITNVNPFFVRDYVATTRHDGYIVFVGRLVAHKGVRTLLEAVFRSKALRAIVVGTGELESELTAWIAERRVADRITLTGPMWGEDLNRVIAGAAAVAVPSEWYDNLPLALCQANALGKPVLASRINGIPEYVQEGVNGFMFTPGEADELASVAERVIGLNASDYAALAVRARAFAEERLDFEQHYKVLSGIFHSLQGSNS